MIVSRNAKLESQYEIIILWKLVEEKESQEELVVIIELVALLSKNKRNTTKNLYSLVIFYCWVS